jgi:hypothetical protein
MKCMTGYWERALEEHHPHERTRCRMWTDLLRLALCLYLLCSDIIRRAPLPLGMKPGCYGISIHRLPPRKLARIALWRPLMMEV